MSPTELSEKPSPASRQAAAAPVSLELLAPAALAKISKLDLLANFVMDGYVQGLHRSQHLGFAVDFAQHRQYVPGDDIKRIDWRLYAKADRYYIKQYEVTTNLRAHIVLDCSASMRYGGANDPLTKFRYAQFVAAALCYLVLHQQDSVGLITVDNKVRTSIPPRSTPSHLIHLVQALEATACTRESALAPLLHNIAEELGHRGMVILISDLFEKTDDLIKAFHHFRHRRHEVILLHVMAQDELSFPFRKWTLFKNLESAEHRLRLDPALVRRQYLDAVSSHLAAIRAAAGAMRISHVLLNTAEPFDHALTMYLAKRMQRRGM